MELKKIHEAYNLLDTKDNWMTSGGVTKSESGDLTVNINTTLKSESEEESNQWGSMYYHKGEDNRITVNYNFEGSYKEEYVDYCEELMVQVLAQIDSELSE